MKMEDAMKDMNGKTVEMGDEVCVLGVKAIVLTIRQVRVGKKTYEKVASCKSHDGRKFTGYSEETLVIEKAGHNGK